MYGSNLTFNGSTMWSSVPWIVSRERDASGGEVRQGLRWGSVVLLAMVMLGCRH